MFDNVCNYLAETFSEDYATWLLGKPVTLTSLSPKELSLEPITADALILEQSDERLAQGLDEAGHLIVAPELIVEIVSPGKSSGDRDRQSKRKLYSILFMGCRNIGSVIGSGNQWKCIAGKMPGYV